MATDIKLVNVRLPRRVTNWLDSLVEQGVYKSRAEAIREFTREYLRSQGDLSE